jgi:hypothetical protein
LRQAKVMKRWRDRQAGDAGVVPWQIAPLVTALFDSSGRPVGDGILNMVKLPRKLRLRCTAAAGLRDHRVLPVQRRLTSEKRTAFHAWWVGLTCWKSNLLPYFQTWDNTTLPARWPASLTGSILVDRNAPLTGCSRNPDLEIRLHGHSMVSPATYLTDRRCRPHQGN